MRCARVVKLCSKYTYICPTAMNETVISSLLLFFIIIFHIHKIDSQLLYDAIRNNSRLINSGNAIREFIYENRHMFKMQMKACRNTVGKPQSLSSTREDDSEWFKGKTN